MKTIKKILAFFSIALFAIGTLAMGSCGLNRLDDGDVDGKITDNGNTVTVTYSVNEYGVSAKIVYTFIFEDDICVSASQKTSGTGAETSTEDVTEEFGGMTKDQIKDTFAWVNSL
jgi:hypothetical protein